MMGLASQAHAFLPSQAAFGQSSFAPAAPAFQSYAQSSIVMSAGGKVLVSGFLDSKTRTDQLVFDVLHAQGSWDKIVAFSHENAFAKKRLVSRKSRYSGLLDKIEFEEGERYDASVMQEKLTGCDAWLCFGCEKEHLKSQVEAAVAAGIKNLVITSESSADEIKESGVVGLLEGAGMEWTFIRTGKVVDGGEGGPIMTGDVEEALPSEEVVRDDIVRVAAESFAMEAATKKAFAFGKGDDKAALYLKGLREQGMDRRAELGELIGGGLAEFVVEKEKEEEEATAELSPEEEEKKKEEFRLSRAEERERVLKAADERAHELMIEKAQKYAEAEIRGEWRSRFIAKNHTCTEDEYLARDANWNRWMKRTVKQVKQEQRANRPWASGDEEEVEEVDDLRYEWANDLDLFESEAKLRAETGETLPAAAAADEETATDVTAEAAPEATPEAEAEAGDAAAETEAAEEGEGGGESAKPDDGTGTSSSDSPP
ncbi:unnamed protein product [Chrysoparadoxa australica]